MCGIFITNDPIVTVGHAEIIEKNLRFRGPDASSGLKVLKNWKSYHSRLAIIEINTGSNQPVINPDGSQLVFNGEILNYKELGRKYFKKEYLSDTKLLNDLIVSNLLDLNELDGFFAFVFVNSSSELKYAARDRFGVKPLFYFERDGCVTFSSEPNVIKEIFDTAINMEAIEEYKIFRAPIFSDSFYEGLKQVQPGCCYINKKYFDVGEELAKVRGKYEGGDLSKALKEGVQTRCISDAPVGLLLSKGIDSNLIRFTGKFDRYYTIGFPEDEDLEYLRNSGIKNLEFVEVKKQEFIDAFGSLLMLRKEPLSVPNEVLLYLIAKKAKRDGVKVLLSGEGADEFFGGYDRVFSWAASKDEFDLDEFLNYYSYTKIQKNSTLYNKISELFEKVKFESVFDTVRWFFIRYHMPILFRRLDFALMAAGVEGREPIANIHLFNVCKELSSDMLMKNGHGKAPLRDLLSNYKGVDFSYEKKVGFPVDMTKIFENKKNHSSYELWFEKNLEVLK